MNITWILPPILALVVVAGWSGSNRYSTYRLDKSSEALQARLSTHPSGPGTDAAASMTKSSGQPGSLKKLATLMAEVQRTGSKLAMMRLDQRIRGMTRDELVSALDEIDGAATSNQWSGLKEKLFQQLCKKDPKSALDRFANSSGSDSRMKIEALTAAMRGWPQKDLAMAENWLTEQIAAGKLDSATYDGENHSLVELENGLVVAQICADPTSATARLSVLPKKRRMNCLFTYGDTPIPEKNQLAYANLVRNFLPEEYRALVIACFADHLGSEAVSNRVLGKSPFLAWSDFPSDYKPFTECFDRIEATPTERADCVEQAISLKLNGVPAPRVSFEEIDVLHAWATEQAPNKADNLTSQVLWHKTKRGASFSEVAEQAVRYSNESGNDGLLFEFLTTKKVPAGDMAEARLLAEKIIDPARRQIVLDRLK